MKNTMKALGLAGIIALSGCNAKTKIYTEEDIKEAPASIELPMSVDERYPGTIPTLNLFIRDLNGDGNADIVHHQSKIYLVAEDFDIGKTKFSGRVDSTTEVMTPSMRTNLSNILKASQDFSREYLINEGLYSSNTDKITK